MSLPRNATGKIHKPTLRKNFSTPKPTDRQANRRASAPQRYHVQAAAGQTAAGSGC